MSKGDLDFDKEDVMSCWVVTPATPPPQQRVLARSKKRKVELHVEEEDEDEEAGNEEEEEDEEDEDDEEEDGDEVVELGEKEKKGKNPEKGKAPQKKRLPIPFFSEVHEGREGAVGEEGQASKKSRKEKDPEDEETKEVRRMNSALEEYGTSVHHLARHVRQCFRGQPGSKTVLAVALQLLFHCPDVVPRSSPSIRSDYLVAQKIVPNLFGSMEVHDTRSMQVCAEIV